MEGKLGQSPTVLFKYKKLILAEEKLHPPVDSVPPCGLFCALRCSAHAAVRHRAFLLFRP